uniref:Uncharacterized protein n=1 Tax=viral metagenome TaxID=1070528 RepID=A0A6C0E952_9ZZZZ
MLLVASHNFLIEPFVKDYSCEELRAKLCESLKYIEDDKIEIIMNYKHNYDNNLILRLIKIKYGINRLKEVYSEIIGFTQLGKTYICRYKLDHNILSIGMVEIELLFKICDVQS